MKTISKKAGWIAVWAFIIFVIACGFAASNTNRLTHIGPAGGGPNLENGELGEGWPMGFGTNWTSLSIGPMAFAEGEHSIAIGPHAHATRPGELAIKFPWAPQWSIDLGLIGEASKPHLTFTNLPAKFRIEVSTKLIPWQKYFDGEIVYTNHAKVTIQIVLDDDTHSFRLVPIEPPKWSSLGIEVTNVIWNGSPLSTFTIGTNYP